MNEAPRDPISTRLGDAPAFESVAQADRTIVRSEETAMVDQTFRIGTWQVDGTAREITDGERVRRLSPRAMGVLACLIEADGSVVSRQCLLETVWPDVHVGDDSLTQAIAELRRAFLHERDRQPFIATVQKSGYRLVMPVTPGAEPKTVSPFADGQRDLPLRAHLAVSEAFQLRWLHGYTACDQMKELMDEAVALAPWSASVQADYAILIGCTILHRGDRDHRSSAALDAANQGIRLRPDLAKTQTAFGFVSGALGRAAECTEAFQKVFTIDPRDTEAHSLAAQAFFTLGAMETALVLAERAAILDSDEILSPYIAARAAIALDKPDKAALAARMCLKRADDRLSLVPDSIRASSARAAALAMLGREQEAWTEVRRLQGEPNFRDIVALAGIHDIPAALDGLETIVENGWRATGWLLKDPVFGQMGDGERFRRLKTHFLAC
ncbi:MAG: winged helix-turn-helix domain-containing protein [Pseudomonadota bacterium]